MRRSSPCATACASRRAPALRCSIRRGLLVGEAAAAAARLQAGAGGRPLLDRSRDRFAGTDDRPGSLACRSRACAPVLVVELDRADPATRSYSPCRARCACSRSAWRSASQVASAMPVAGVVDAAVAACAELPAHATVLHLDIHLHQAVLTQLQGASLLRRSRVEIAPRVGIKALHAAWAHLISEAMVRRTRFDPLHHAASEQQLLPAAAGLACSAVCRRGD